MVRQVPAFAVLIPSRMRADILKKTLERMPFLNSQHTFIGIDHSETEDYTFLLHTKIHIVTYDNSEGSVGLCREELRQRALMSSTRYQVFVATDDNARYTEDALRNLVLSQYEWEQHAGSATFMAGMHSTASHFDRNLIKQKETLYGLTTYPGIGFIFHAMSRAWYERYQYPEGCFALEDRHMMLSAIATGETEFRICMDAPFSKSRYQPGGQGDIKKRRWNCGRAIEQLAHDYPSLVGARGTFPIPWQFIMKLQAGASVDRLMGGAMRKAEVLTRSPMTVKARRVKRTSTKERK